MRAILAMRDTKTTILGWFIFATGAIFYCYEYLLRISPNVMTTQLMNEFNLTAGALGELIAFYYFIYTPMQLPVGIMMDKYGPRALLTGACLICALSAFWFAHINEPAFIGVTRFLIGLGSAFAFVGVLKLAIMWLPRNYFALAAGLVSSLGIVGAAVGDIAVAKFVELFGWRSVVLYSSFIGFALTIFILYMIKNQSSVSKVNSSENKSLSFKKLGQEILILVKTPLIWINGIIGCLLYVPISAFAELWGVSYLKIAYGYNRQMAMFSIFIMFFGWALFGPVVGWLSDKFKTRKYVMMTGAVTAAMVMLIILYVPEINKHFLYALLFLLGVSSSVQIIVFPIGHELGDENIAATAVAFTNMLVMTGGMIFQPVIGHLLDKHHVNEIIKNAYMYTTADYQLALSVIPLSIIVGIVLLIIMPETYKKHN